MKGICITGALQSDLLPVARNLSLAGAHSAKPAARGDLVDLDFWHEQVLAAAAEAFGTKQPILNPGRLWEQLASDFFVANLHSKVWCWSDPRSTWLLDFWLGFEPRLNFILVTRSPVDTLASAISAEGEFGAVDEIMSTWQSHHQELLRFYHRNPQRCILVDAKECVAHPQALINQCNAQWKLGLAGVIEDTSSLSPAAPLSFYLAGRLCEGYPEAVSLQREIAATVVRLGSEPTVSAASETVVDAACLVFDYRALRKDCEQQTQVAEQRYSALMALAEERVALAQENSRLTVARDELGQENKELRRNNELISGQLHETKHESERMLQKLHQVQEELANQVLTTGEIERQLASKAAAGAQALAKCEALEQEKSKLAAEVDGLARGVEHVRHERDAMSSQLKESGEEGELLLSQLHQVQEELEHYFLLNQEAQQKLAEADRRWQRMLARTPNYLDFESIEILSAELDGADGCELSNCTWRIRNMFTAGRAITQVDFKVGLDNQIAFFTLLRQPNSPQHLIRWPVWAAEQSELNLCAADLAETGPEARLDLATSDLDLIHTLSDVVLRVLDTPTEVNALSRLPLAPLRAGLVALRQLLEQIPPLLRFDAVCLIREEANPDYEHLWIRLDGLSFGKVRWPAFEFRLACAAVRPAFGIHPKLEFPQHVGQAPLSGWFEESADEFGAKLELRFAMPDAMDITVWQKISATDRVFLQALIQRLPVILNILEVSGLKIKRPWSEWILLASEMQRVMMLRVSVFFSQAPESSELA